MDRSKRLAVAVLAACAMIVAACGEDDAPEITAGGEVAPTLEESKGARGTVSFCAGKDLTGDHRDVIKSFNARYADQGLRAELREFPPEADEVRNQFVQRQEARSGECDVFYSDVVWTAEFSAQGWLLDMTSYVEERQDEFIPSTLETIKVGDKFFGVPKQTDAGFIYYRSDQVDGVPETWQALYDLAEQNDGLVYQGVANEGGTVNFLEIAFAAGGRVLSEDGKTSEIDSPENLRALEFMVEGIESGAAPEAVTTYDEEASRRAWEAGRATFMRNWPYAFSLARKAPKIKGNFAVAPFPEFEGGGRAGILGGHNSVISAYSENPEGAVLFIDHQTSPEIMRRHAIEFAQAPVLEATYDEPSVQEALPFSAELKQAVEQAQSRPVSAVYPQITAAIQKNYNAALAGQMSPEEALKKADQQINEALKTF